jgi:hypothetical protein
MKRLSKTKYSLLVILFLTATLSCKSKDFGSEPTTSSGGGGGGSTSGGTPATSTSPLTLTLGTRYDNTLSQSPLTFDVYNGVTHTSSTTCAATTTDNDVTCTVTVPEGQLYFSSVIFAYSRLISKCRLLEFQPYTYMADNTAAYVPPGQVDSIDCTATPAPVGCYGGAAKSLVTSFPTFTSILYTPDETSATDTHSLTLTSGWSQSTLSNRRAANDMPVGDDGVNYTAADLGGAGDGYVMNTFRDYEFFCYDDWVDLVPGYHITLKITEEDQDTGNPAANAFWSWVDHL